MSNPKPLNDDEREDLVAYLDGELDPKTSRSIESQMSLNPEARREADSLRRTWEMLDYLPKPEPSPHFTHRTMERLAVQKVKARDQRRPWLIGIGWAAALLLAVASSFIGTRFYLQRKEANLEQQMVRDVSVVENLDLYEDVDDIEFLLKLADDPDLFGEEDRGM